MDRPHLPQQQRRDRSKSKIFERKYKWKELLIKGLDLKDYGVRLHFLRACTPLPTHFFHSYFGGAAPLFYPFFFLSYQTILTGNTVDGIDRVGFLDLRTLHLTQEVEIDLKIDRLSCSLLSWNAWYFDSKMDIVDFSSFVFQYIQELDRKVTDFMSVNVNNGSIVLHHSHHFPEPLRVRSVVLKAANPLSWTLLLDKYLIIIASGLMKVFMKDFNPED